MAKNIQNVDVIISGGGLSGCLMALSLSKLTKTDGSLLSIALVEANYSPQHAEQSQQRTQVKATPLFDDRVLALSHGSAAYLAELNVWQHLSNNANDTNGACAIEKIDISDRGHYGKARLEAQEHAVAALGYVISMAHLGNGLLKGLATKKNIHWFSPDKISNIIWQSEDNTKTVTIELDSKQTLTANLLLACDGANSPCRQLAGIKVKHSDYNQVALIANVATEKPHHNKAFERFTEFGPLAMLPLSQLPSSQLKNKNRCSLVWTMTPEQSETILALNDTQFNKQLEQAFGSWLGEITHVGKRDIYPLVLLQAQQQTYHRMALIGNASHTIHPIAGQGFNLGLRDVKLMADLIAKSLSPKSLSPNSTNSSNKDIGRFALLHEYATQRQQDQQQVITLTDSLVTLFANDLPPLVAGRNIGLKVMNYVSPIKNSLVSKFMGY